MMPPVLGYLRLVGIALVLLLLTGGATFPRAGENREKAIILTFKGYTTITATMEGARRVTGVNDIEYVSLTFDYLVVVNTSLNLESFEREKCDVIVNITSITVAIRPENSSFTPPSTPMAFETKCSNEPYILVFTNGSFEFKSYPGTLYLQGFTRMDVDTAHYIYFLTVMMFNETSNQAWSVYVEPLSKLPILVSFDEQKEVEGVTTLTVHSVVYMENTRHTFREFLGRLVYDFVIAGESYTGSLILIHSLDENKLNSTAEIIDNETIAVKLGEPVTCFIIVEAPYGVEVSSNAELRNYTSIGSTIYYSARPANCSTVSFRFSKNVTLIFKPEFPEKGVNPKHNPPSADVIATTLVFDIAAAYLVYAIVGKLLDFTHGGGVFRFRLIRRLFKKFKIMLVHR
jgi:hypothetical protein